MSNELCAIPSVRALRAPLAAAIRPLLLLAALVLVVPTLAVAGNGRGHGHNVHLVAHYDSRGYVLDTRYHHNHYYPPRGYVVRALPRGYVTVHYRGGPYYYYRGVWYRPGHGHFVVVRPAVGVFVPFLPPFYTTVWFAGVPYYYANDVYYVWRPHRRGYEVVEPPGGVSASTTAPASPPSELYIYPKKGQSEEQQARDRYECHSWASSQTGFDPTEPLGGVGESQAMAKRADYQRAMQACLEARGYSVK